MSEDDSYTRWIEWLHLYEPDRIALLNGKELSDTVINAAQFLLSRQFSKISGFQNTLLANSLQFSSIPSIVPSVQILYTGMLYSRDNVQTIWVHVLLYNIPIKALCRQMKHECYPFSNFHYRRV